MQPAEQAGAAAGWQGSAVQVEETAGGSTAVNPEPGREQRSRAGVPCAMGTDFTLLMAALISKWADVQREEKVCVLVENQEFGGQPFPIFQTFNGKI